MDKRISGFVLLTVLFFCSVLSVFLLSNLGLTSANFAEKSRSQSIDDFNSQTTNTSTPMNQAQQTTDSFAPNQSVTDNEADWLKARVAALRSAGSSLGSTAQPGSFEAYTEYFVTFDAQTLNQIETAQGLYEQYVRNPGPDSPITQVMLQVLNQAKLKESLNLFIINSQIDQLVVNGTLTSGQGVVMKDRVQQLRTP
jgi:hypothetical protein